MEILGTKLIGMSRKFRESGPFAAWQPWENYLMPLQGF